MEKKYLTLKEKICFPLSAFGRSGILYYNDNVLSCLFWLTLLS